jgi:DNA-binding NtrC family response regulator
MHTLTDDAIAVLHAHAWPGNVRELRATMRRVAVLADSKLIRGVDLGLTPASSSVRSVTGAVASTTGDAASLRALIDAAVAPGAPLQPLAGLRDEVVRRYVELAVARSDGDREAAAKALEIGVRSLYRYLA